MNFTVFNKNYFKNWLKYSFFWIIEIIMSNLLFLKTIINY